MAVAHEPLINYGGRRTVTGGAKAKADDEELYRKEKEKERRYRKMLSI